MKRSIFIFLCLLLMVTAFADVRFQPIYLRLTSYPRNAGVVFAENPYRNSGQPEFHVSKSFSFNSIEESDTDMVEIKMVLYAATGDARYKVYAKPNDGFFFLGFNQSEYVGPDWLDWGIHGEDEYFIYFAPDDDKWDTCFVFTGNVGDYYIFKENPAEIVHEIIQGPMYFFGKKSMSPWYDGELVQSYPFIFTPSPCEYCWAIFARVIVKNANGGKATITNHSDKQSDDANDIGDEVCITAVANSEDNPFQYWIEESTGRHIVENPYTFTVTHQDAYTPYFGSSPEGIDEVHVSKSITGTSASYTLDGKRLRSDPQRGAFIKNGKKLVR